VWRTSQWVKRHREKVGFEFVLQSASSLSFFPLIHFQQLSDSHCLKSARLVVDIYTTTQQQSYEREREKDGETWEEEEEVEGINKRTHRQTDRHGSLTAKG
jgi:hypothetical protein